MAESPADHPLWQTMRAICSALTEVSRYEWHVRSPDDADASEAPLSVVDLPEPRIVKQLEEQPGGIQWEVVQHPPTRVDLPGPQALINAMEGARQAADPKFRQFRHLLRGLHSSGGVELAGSAGESWSDWVLSRARDNFQSFHAQRRKGLAPIVKPEFNREWVEKKLQIEYLDAGAPVELPRPTDNAVQSDDEVEAIPVEGDDPNPVAVTVSGSVRLFDRPYEPIVKGTKKPKLTKAQYDVVLALLQTGGEGLTKDKLDHKSGHGDARRILKRLSDNDPDWESVISFPGTTGKGYRII